MANYETDINSRHINSVYYIFNIFTISVQDWSVFSETGNFIRAKSNKYQY